MNIVNSKVLKIIINIFKKFKLLTTLLIISIICTILLSLLTPQVLKYIIDDYLILGKSNLLYIPALIYFFTLVLAGMFNLLKEGLLTIFGQKIIKEIKEVMINKLEKIPISYLSINPSGVIVSRFSNDVEAVGSLFTNGIVSMIIDTLKIIGIVISIWIFSYKLVILVILIIPVIYFLTRFFQKKMLSAQKLYRLLIGKVNNHIPETIKNIQMIKSFCKEKYMEEKYITYLNDSYDAMDKINFYDSIFSPIILIIRSIVIAVVVIISSDKLGFLGLSIGTVAASIELITNIFAPIESIGMELQTIQQSIAGIYRIDEFLDEDEDIKKDNKLTLEYLINRRGNLNIIFDNVSFSYAEGVDVLSDISLVIKDKEKITFAGRTGSGKSTIFKLILGLLVPRTGRVTLGGVDICKIPNYEKRKIFGYVEQSFRFIKGNVIDQITLGDKSIVYSDIVKAVKFVGLHEYILSFDEGYNTHVNEYLFSQGQRQLLSIARAIVTNPPILLLDEMTANLDLDTEDKIITVLKNASKDRTVLSISHRLSSKLISDRIILLEDKGIINYESAN